MSSPLEKQDTVQQSTPYCEDVAEELNLKVDESLAELDLAPQNSIPEAVSDYATKRRQPSDSANDAALSRIDEKAFALTIVCCYLPAALYLLFAVTMRLDDSPSQLIRYSTLILTSPLVLILPLQLRWREHVAGLAKSLNVQTCGRFPFSDRYYNWLGFGIGPWVLLFTFLGTKIYKGLYVDGLLPPLSPVADIVLAIGTVALIIMGTTLPLLVSAMAFLKFFGAINSAVKPVNIATVGPSPLLSSAIVSGGLLVPVMVLCWSCPPLNLLALPLQIAGWWFAFKEIDKYADWVKTNRQK